MSLFLKFSIDHVLIVIVYVDDIIVIGIDALISELSLQFALKEL